MDYGKESLRLHEKWRGKLEINSKVDLDTGKALSLAYTPGVAAPCLEIERDVDRSYDLTTRRKNGPPRPGWV